MPDRLSFQHTFHALERAMGITQKRNDLIASNISNLDTPNYRSKDIDFEAAMARALASDQNTGMKKTHPKHMDLSSNSAMGEDIFEEKGEWNGINWVNVDESMVKLTENSLLYRTAAETLLRKLALVREVIKEGGR